MQPDALSLAAIRDGAAVLGVALTDRQAEQLGDFARLLLRWNATHNLTAIDRPSQVLTHHLFDSLAIVSTLTRLRVDAKTSVLDVGSGGGLPGIPLAIVLPAWHVTLIDKVRKKTAFLTQAVVELGLRNVDVVHGSVETLVSADFDIVVSRAFASLSDFVRLSRGALAPGGTWVAMRGAEPLDDTAPLPAGVRVEQVVKLRVPHLDAQRHLVVLRAEPEPSHAPD